MDDLIRNFENPPKEYRAKPFWAWNGKLEETELLRQIDVFQQMGFGGFFMHSRTGLQTAYLSEEWFSLTDACTKAACGKGMEPWIYDEDRWPSGSAGGLVTREERHRRKYLTLTLNETGKKTTFGGICSGMPWAGLVSWLSADIPGSGFAARGDPSDLPNAYHEAPKCLQWFCRC